VHAGEAEPARKASKLKHTLVHTVGGRKRWQKRLHLGEVEAGWALRAPLLVSSVAAVAVATLLVVVER